MSIPPLDIPQLQLAALCRGHHIRPEVSAFLGRPVDLVPEDSLSPLIRESVLASAEEIYAA